MSSEEIVARWCRDCDKFHWRETEACDPAWEVWDEDESYNTEEEPWGCCAPSAGEAAERYAKDHLDGDCCESIAAEGFVPIVFVKGVGGELWKFEVYGEMKPVYNADKIEGPERKADSDIPV